MADQIKYEVYDDVSTVGPTVGGGSGLPPRGPVGIENPVGTGVVGSGGLSTSQVVNPDKMAQMVQDYVQRVRPKIWIMTPCYGGMCHVNYVQAMMATMEVLGKLGVRFHFEFCKNDSLITRARNNMVAKAMTDPEMTHMMFIDNDITWKPIDIVRMMVSGKDLIGGIYPIKNYDWTRLVKDPLNPYNSNVVRQWLDCKDRSDIGRFLTEEQMVQANMLKYNVNYLSANLQIADNLTRVRHLPTGFMMIQRSVILKMQEQMADKKYTDDVNYLTEAENANAYALFDCAIVEGHYFSEDWYFCEKWQGMGGEIWADVSINLTHTGMEDYKGSFIASLMSMQ